MKKLGKQITAICAVALLLGAASGCGFQTKTVKAEELSKAYTRTATERGEATDELKIGLSDFSFSLFKKAITKDGENDLISPLSAALCLALINNGASGNTRAQIEELFGMQTADLNRALYAYTASLYSSDDCKVSLANSIWIKEGSLNVKSQFLQDNADWFKAQVYAAPFDQTTVQDINNWAYNATKGKISRILNAIPPLAVMYLVNALDFDAKWEEKYEKSDIHERTFYNYDDSNKTLDFLYSTENTYFYEENAIGFARPYKDNRYSFVALLPNEDTDVYEYVERIDGEYWQNLWANSQSRPVYARIPEFDYEAELTLNDALKSLGLTDMFLESYADFSNISEKQLYCSSVVQKTFIQLDRNGTKAAAITIGGMKDTAIQPEEHIYITLDRPFVYAIVDNEHKLPLFLGAVTYL